MSLAAVAAINYTIIHNSFVFVALFVLLAHELGHFFVAKKHGGNPSLPIFIPIPFLLIALVKVQEMSDEGILKTSFYGPFTGFLTTLLIILFNIIFKLLPVIPLIILALSEIVLNYFGSDGTKYRAAKRRILSCL